MSKLPRAPATSSAACTPRGEGCPSLITAMNGITPARQRTSLWLTLPASALAVQASCRPFRETRPTCSASRQFCAAVLCGKLIHAGFDTLVEAGYEPEMAYFGPATRWKLMD